MLNTLIFAAAFLLLAALGILITRSCLSHGRSTRQLRKVDIPAFRNLASSDEDLFLRRSLRAVDYRVVRRSRLRAMQEYLLWIAANCSVIIALLRAEAAAPQMHVNVPQAARMAAQIRLMCLGYWCLLWLEYLLPNLNVRPLQLLRKYEELWLSSETLLLTDTATSMSLS